MDKLQPILKHHFWILAFLVLPLGFWGYYSANSSLNAATEAREGELDTAYSQIPPGTSPNKTWETEMKVVADGYDAMVTEEVLALHEQQESQMDWPPIMARGEPEDYRGAWNRNLQAAYNDEYPELLRGVWERYQPVVTDLEEGADRSWITWDEKVLIEKDAIQPVHQFGNLRATDEQIWDAQEDIWLHRMIADAVVRTNEDADSTYTAIVKNVLLVELMGGDGKPVAAGGGQSGQGAGQNPSAAGYDGDYQGGSGGGRGAGRRGSTATAVAFDPAEEIGGGGRAAASRGRGRGSSGGMDSAAPTGSAPGGQGGAAGGSAVLRYVGAGTNDKSNVRAFYMSVIVDQQKFPEFLVELCNSDWPIEIVRFNIGPNPNYSPAQTAGRTGIMGGGYSGPMGGGYSGPMGNRPGGGGPRPPGASGSPMNRPMGPGMGGSGPGGSPMGGFDGVGRQQDHEAFGALDTSNLVQLDLLGLITIFNPGERPEVTAVPAGTAVPAEEEAADPAAEDVTAETEGDPVTDEAAGDPADSEATDDAESTDAAEGTVEEPETSTTEESADEPEPTTDEADQSTDNDESEGTVDPDAASETEAATESEEVPAVEETAGVE